MSRIHWALLLIVSLSSPALVEASSQAGEPGGAARAVGCIGLTVTDVDRAAEFYARVLDFRRELEAEVEGDSGRQTTVRGGDLEAAAGSARGAGMGWISPGPVAVAEQQLGFSRALLARDPDGHVVQLSVANTNEARSTR